MRIPGKKIIFVKVLNYIIKKTIVLSEEIQHTFFQLFERGITKQENLQ
jgi:hypothetical protein